MSSSQPSQTPRSSAAERPALTRQVGGSMPPGAATRARRLPTKLVTVRRRLAWIPKDKMFVRNGVAGLILGDVRSGTLVQMVCDPWPVILPGETVVEITERQYK